VKKGKRDNHYVTLTNKKIPTHAFLALDVMLVLVSTKKCDPWQIHGLPVTLHMLRVKGD